MSLLDIARAIEQGRAAELDAGHAKELREAARVIWDLWDIAGGAMAVADCPQHGIERNRCGCAAMDP